MRRAGIAFLGILAVVAITVVSIGYWARQQVLSTDRFVAALSALPADPQGQEHRGAAASRVAAPGPLTWLTGHPRQP